MIKRFLLLLASASVVQGAITEHWVSTDGTQATTWATCTGASEPGSAANRCTLTFALANAVAGDRVNIKAGTYSRSANDTFTNAGTVTSPIIYRGYSSTLGDGNLGRTNGNGDLITTNMPLLSYSSTFSPGVTGAFTILESLNVVGLKSGVMVTVGVNSAAKSCRAENQSTNASAGALSSGANNNNIIFDCDALLTGASGGLQAIKCDGGGTKCVNNRAKGGTAIGMVCISTASCVGNVVYASTGIGISVNSTTGSSLIYGNTIVGGSSDGINVITANTALQGIFNNLITDNTGFGINMVSAANGGFLAYNRTRNNTAGAINSGTDWVAATTYAHVTTDLGTDYTSSGTNDYSLLVTSPAKGAGWFSSLDIGALQRVEPVASAAAGGRIPSIGGR